MVIEKEEVYVTIVIEKEEVYVTMEIDLYVY